MINFYYFKLYCIHNNKQSRFNFYVFFKKILCCNYVKLLTNMKHFPAYGKLGGSIWAMKNALKYLIISLFCKQLLKGIS